MTGTALGPERGEVLWQPGPDAWETALGRFARRHGLRPTTPTLHAWSVADLDGFWCGRRRRPRRALARRRPSAVLAERADARRPLVPRRHAQLRRARPGRAPPTGPATSPSSPAARPAAPIELTWAELAEQVARAAAGLRRLGVGPRRPGRRLRPEHPRDAGRLPRHRRRSGAVWSTLRPGVRHPRRRRPLRPDRAGRCCSPSTATATATKAIDRRAEVAAIRAALPSAAPRRAACATSAPAPTAGRELLGRARPRARPTFEPVPFDHPLYVLYSSGTTGLPKPIVHGHGGITLEHLKVLALHQDLGPGDRFCWFTTTGWMMWNLPRVGPARRGRRRALRRRPRPPGPRHAVGPGRGDRLPPSSAPRRRSSWPAARRASSRPDRRRPALGRLDRRAAAGRGLPLGARRRSGVPVSLDQRRHRRVHRLRRHGARCCRCGRARSAAGCSGCAVEAFDPDGQAVPARACTGELVDHRADAVDAGRLLGRRRRLAATGPPTSRTSPACGATATGSPSPTTAPASSPAAPTPPSTGAASASAPATSTPWSRRCPRWPTAWSSTSRTARAAAGELLLFVAPPPGATSTTTCARRIAARAAHASCRPATCPTASRPCPRPPHAVGQEARGAGQADPHRHPGRAGGLPRLARRPRPRWPPSRRSPPPAGRLTPARGPCCSLSGRRGRRRWPGSGGPG